MNKATLLCNGRFYTSERTTNLQTLAVENGTITAIGSHEEMMERFPHPINSIDLQGQTVWPGLTDSHLHLALLAEYLSAIDCETNSLDECLQRIAKASCERNDRSWVIGYGWNHNAWNPREYGTASQLDQVSTSHPVVLYAKSLHASWANSAALRLAKVDRTSPDPIGGQIMRDAQGTPTGILLENAMALVDQVIPEHESAELIPMLKRAQTHLLSLGITCVHDFDRMPCYLALQAMEKSGDLILRVRKNLPCDMLEEIAAAEWRSNSGSEHLFTGSLKCFADGALGPQSAAMLKPYEGSDSLGMLLMNAEDVFQMGSQAAAAGWPMAIHAIGDAANRAVLDGYKKLRAYETVQSLPHLPHRIEHVQIIDPQDQSRLHSLDIIASMQPIHATSDMYTADRFWGSRSANAYAFHSLSQQGVLLIFGSDAPVESANPFRGLHAAVTRQRHTGEPGPEGWYPEERLSLKSALAAYTINPAQSCGRGNSLGRIAIGYKADLIVLPCDPFTQDPQTLWNIQPDMTLVDGKNLYQK